MVILKIIEAVVYDRLQSNSKSRNIRLSPDMMKKLIDEINKYTGNVEYEFDPNIQEIKYTFWGQVYDIYHRGYRDETNDPEVVEKMYEITSKYFKIKEIMQ